MVRLEPGDELGGYRIEAQLARGGMGVLYRAHQRRPLRTVAVKVILAEVGEHPDFRRRFEQEASVAAEIEHPNVIPVYEVGEDAGSLFIAMRLIDGIDLARVLARHGQLEPRHAARLIAQVTGALDAAHGRGLVHRDVKPGNVLVTLGGHVYLTDFGISKRIADTAGLTKTGSPIGTPDYIAPEQVEGHHVDLRADVYALGCMTYQLLCGRVPFPRESEIATLFAHLSDPPPRLENVPAALADEVERAMAKRPDDRFHSAGEFGRAVMVAATGRAESNIGRILVAGTAGVPREADVPDPRAARPGAAGARSHAAKPGASEGPGGRADRSGPREAHAAPRTATLIGREREVKELSALLADPDTPMVTLVGTGGAGKTALALHVARESGASFSDGVTVVWLANISDAGQVLPEVARRLGVELTSQEPPLATLAGVLRLQRRLLGLDKVERVLDAAPAMAELIAECGQLKVLATSRSPLRVSFERVYSVLGLEVPARDSADSVHALGRWPATALFVERARAADSTFELTADAAGAITALCRYLGGLPLALELAAARTRVLSPRQILHRLRTSSDVLGPGRRDAPERQQTLQATIEWSLNLLTNDEQRLFAVLGLFVGAFAADGAQAVCDDAVPDVLDGLATLLDHSLLQRARPPRGPRLSMLEPIREFALQRLRADDALHRSALIRYAEYYAKLAEAAEAQLKGRDQLQCLEQLGDELPNLRAVMTGARSQPQLDLALRIASGLIALWLTRDLASEIRAWLRWAVVQPLAERGLRTRGLIVLGGFAADDGDLDEAKTALTACLCGCYELDDPSLTARCEALLARCLYWLRQDSADVHAERALSIAAETGDPWTEARVLSILSTATGDYDVARDRFQRALRLYASVGDRLWSSRTKGNLSGYAVMAADYGYARTLSEEAAAEGQGIWGASHTAQLESLLGLADLFEGRHSNARQHLSRSLALSRRIGWWATAQLALAGLAAVAAIEGGDKDGAMLAAAGHAVSDKPLNRAAAELFARLDELSNGVISAARDQPALSTRQLDAVLRDASVEQAVEDPIATAPNRS